MEAEGKLSAAVSREENLRREKPRTQVLNGEGAPRLELRVRPGLPAGTRRSESLSVFGKLLGVVDDENLAGSSFGFQFEAKLLLNCDEDRGTLLVVFRASQAGGLSLVGCPLQREIVISGEAGMIQDGMV